MKSKILQFFLFFFIFLVIFQLFGFNKPPANTNTAISDIELTVTTPSINIGDSLILNVKNNLAQPVTLPNDCPKEPLDVLFYKNGSWSQITQENPTAECAEMTIQPGETKEINYGKWKTMFAEFGKYKIELPITINNESKKFFAEFEVVETGFFETVWDKFFYKPIYNILVFFISVLPRTQNLAFAIILLTVFIKLILLVPNNKAIRSQRELQKVQPHLEEVKQKYAGDKQKIAEETMKIWKEHKVNPFGSCLPLLIQFPIMIALFYVVKDGLNIDENTHLLYSFMKDGTLIIDPWFMWVLDLTKTNLYVLPAIVGGLQFFQMRLSLAQAKQKKPAVQNKQMDQMQQMNSMMQYILPVMVAFFTASLPAAVGLYWGVSTVFALVQQYFVMKKS